MTTTPTLFPVLRYRDAHAAINWLERAFGCKRLEIHEDDDGMVTHAELDFDGARLMLSSEPEEGDPRWGEQGKIAGRGWLYVAVDDPDGLYESAMAAGAEVVMELADQDYGSRDFSVRDPEGNLWSFGTYRPGA